MPLDDPASDAGRIAGGAAPKRRDRRRTLTRIKVRVLHEQGCTGAQIAEVLDIARPTVCFHLRNLGVPPESRFARRFDWSAIAEYYAAGHSVRDCRERFGFSRDAWYAAAERGDVAPRARLEPIEQILASGRPRNRSHVKLRLLQAGLKTPRCEVCGIDSWCGETLSLDLHHVNGDGHDNRLENLQLLCPNCHSQTENWGGRNKGRGSTGRGAGRASGMSEAPTPDEDETGAPPAEGDADEPDGDREATPPTPLRTRG